MADVVIVGAGPAGWALASACARCGLHTVLVARSLERWPATYGLWRDELPELPEDAIAAAPSSTIAVGTSRHELERDYLVVDNEGLRRWLTHPDVEIVTDVTHGAVVVDATGVRRAGIHTEQTAYGLTVANAEPLVPRDTALFMDWSASGREPSFLYAVPIGDRVLVEETSLARRPGLPLDVLAARLRYRLVKAGISPDGEEELVRIPLDLPPARSLTFGAAAGLIHPATGYSLATSLRLAPAVAEAIRDGLRISPAEAVRAARQEIWPPAARAVQALRRHGMRALEKMPPEMVPEFFELFFQLPSELQCAFTSGRTDVTGTAAAMAALFRAAPWRLRMPLTF